MTSHEGTIRVRIHHKFEVDPSELSLEAIKAALTKAEEEGYTTVSLDGSETGAEQLSEGGPWLAYTDWQFSAESPRLGGGEASD